jgi:inorganic pyrophosphatase/exopolyphosphatase
MIYAEDTDFISLFKNFKNIYLVDFNEKEKEITTAKKVTVKYIPTL